MNLTIKSNPANIISQRNFSATLTQMVSTTSSSQAINPVAPDAQMLSMLKSSMIAVSSATASAISNITNDASTQSSTSSDSAGISLAPAKVLPQAVPLAQASAPMMAPASQSAALVLKLLG